MQDYTRQAAATIWDWLAITDEPQPCDLLFLFGGAVIATAQKAKELYSQNFSKLIITTGKAGTFGNPHWAEPIADVFADYLYGHGVPMSAVTIQNESMNTLEDVLFSLNLMKSKGLPHSCVTLISRPFHQRRSCATYQKHDPLAQIINVPCNEPHPNSLQGSEWEQVATRCVQECERLQKYAKQGDLVPQSVPDSVSKAYSILKERTAR